MLNEAREAIGVYDRAESVLWVSRYCEPGEFELLTPLDGETAGLFMRGSFVARLDDPMVGVIESLRTTSDEDEGRRLLVSGRCAKSLLSRRIVWGQQDFSGTSEARARAAILGNAVSPEDPARRLPGLALGEYAGLGSEAESQATGDNLMETVASWLNADGLGWAVELNGGGEFEVRVYAGADRSEAQEAVPRVTFCPEMDNLASSEYSRDDSESANVALVGGEGEGASRAYASVGEAEGLARRECFVDARGTSSVVEGGELSEAEYEALLIDKGRTALAEKATKVEFSGEIAPGGVFALGVDYFLGDIVSVRDENGISGTARVVEVCECEDSEGRTVEPVFEEWSADGDN